MPHTSHGPQRTSPPRGQWLQPSSSPFQATPPPEPSTRPRPRLTVRICAPSPALTGMRRGQAQPSTPPSRPRDKSRAVRTPAARRAPCRYYRLRRAASPERAHPGPPAAAARAPRFRCLQQLPTPASPPGRGASGAAAGGLDGGGRWSGLSRRRRLRSRARERGAYCYRGGFRGRALRWGVRQNAAGTAC